MAHVQPWYLSAHLAGTLRGSQRLMALTKRDTYARDDDATHVFAGTRRRGPARPRPRMDIYSGQFGRDASTVTTHHALGTRHRTTNALQRGGRSDNVASMSARPAPHRRPTFIMKPLSRRLHQWSSQWKSCCAWSGTAAAPGASGPMKWTLGWCSI